MSSDKQLAPNTPNGLFAFTLNPNNFVDAVKLETDFKSILCLWIWLIAQIGWVIFLKRDVSANYQASDDEDNKNQNRINNANLENLVLNNTRSASSQSRNSVRKSKNSVKKRQGRKIEI